MRLFTAICFDDKTKIKLKEIQDKLNPLCARGSFTRKDNFHLTLQFLGERPAELVLEMEMALKKNLDNVKPFELGIEKLGYFERQGKKIVWLGVKSQNAVLNELYRKTEDKLIEISALDKRQQYSPHITLAREVVFKDNAAIITEMIEMPELSIKVDRICIMQSTRQNDRLVYLPVNILHL